MIAHLITRLSMGGAQQIALNVANKSLDLDEKGLFITGLSNEKSDAPNNYLLDGVNSSLKLEIVEELSDKISLKNDIIAFFLKRKLFSMFMDGVFQGTTISKEKFIFLSSGYFIFLQIILFLCVCKTDLILKKVENLKI